MSAQGKSQRDIAKELGVSPDKLEPATSRSPMRPTEMYIIANEEK